MATVAHTGDEGGEKSSDVVRHGTTGPAPLGDPDMVTAVEAGDGAEDRGRSGRGSDLERRRRKRNQAEPIFSAHKRGGSKGKEGEVLLLRRTEEEARFLPTKPTGSANCFSPRQAHAARRQVSGFREHVAARVRS